MRYLEFKLNKVHTIGVCLFLFLALACQQPEESALTKLEQYYKTELKQCIIQLDSIAQSKSEPEKHFRQARIHFKRVEAILAFVDKENYKSLNHPNLLMVDEEDATAIKTHQPFGLQVLEEQVYSEKTPFSEIKKNAELSSNRLKLILTNTQLRLSDYHILWLMRDEIIRLATMGITSFDSPVLEQSLSESAIVYRQMHKVLQFYEKRFQKTSLYKKWQHEILKSIEALDADFDTFDRYTFIKDHTHAQLELIQETRLDWGVEFPYELAFQNNITSLFTDSTFNLNFFSEKDDQNNQQPERIALGKRLFNDNRLSKDKTMSCATCHHADKAFTDGLSAFPKQSRNTPTLRYSALQKSFFHDGRAGSLEGQIVGVVTNINEFHTDLQQVTKVVASQAGYKNAFRKAYNGKIDSQTIRNAIASYIRTLSAFNSKFDQNINGKEETLNRHEINGFNLFMGKAKCATCHFPPLFNGTKPPYFNESELEALGIPQDTLPQSLIDPDLGRYQVFKTQARKHFFKTPTVRNAASTAPYMHNGVYTKLEQVMDFYNKGGGTGLGFNANIQTLPSDSLQLSGQETQDIIAFINSLSDR